MIKELWNNLLRFLFIEEEEEMCEMYIDHMPVWDGCGFVCAICGHEFTSKHPEGEKWLESLNIDVRFDWATEEQKDHILAEIIFQRKDAQQL